MTLTESAYANRVLPDRESPFEVGSTLLSGLAIIFAIAALVGALANAIGLAQVTTLVAHPFKPGFIAMFLAIVGLAISGDRTRYGRFALAFATLAWLIGGTVAVLADKPIW